MATPSKKTKPAFVLFTTRGEKAPLVEIGALWPNKSGNGFSGKIDLMALDGRILMFEYNDKPKSED